MVTMIMMILIIIRIIIIIIILRNRCRKALALDALACTSAHRLISSYVYYCCCYYLYCRYQYYQYSHYLYVVGCACFGFSCFSSAVRMLMYLPLCSVFAWYILLLLIFVYYY